MDVNFAKSKCVCLETVIQEVRNGEQSQEIKLPDGMPDIGRILCAWGQCILRGKEWRGDCASFTGGMMVWVLYAPEDGTQARCIDAWIPFQMKWDLPQDVPDGTIRLHCLTRFVDARSVSARKIMVRAGVGVLMNAMVPKSVDVCTPPEDTQGVELLKEAYPVRLPLEAGEKTFLQDEELTIPDSAPQPKELVCFHWEPKVTDKKVLTGRLVFRGTGQLHLLYQCDQGRLHSWDFEIPFSQYCELGREYGTDAQAELWLNPSGLELELDGMGNLHLKCGVVTQYLITDKKMTEVVGDAYSPGKSLELHAETLELPAVLETRREILTPEQSLGAAADVVVDICFLPDFPQQHRTECGVDLAQTGLFQTLYYDDSGVLQSGSTRWEGTTALDADPHCRLTALPGGAQAQVASGGGRLTLKAEVPVAITATAQQEIPMVTGVTVGGLLEKDPNRPSLILCRRGEKRLWDIAKACGSTVGAIHKANGLQEEPHPEKMLLIPIL